MSSRPVLIIGNRTYSSWSLRPWLFLRHFGVDFDTEMVPLDTPQFAARVGVDLPSGRVPMLIDGDLKVWDSLAICEYMRETHKIADAWPRERAARATARSVVAEMHSGFAALRNAMPLNLRREQQPLPTVDADVARDIERILSLWRDCRARFGAEGPFLFGRFSIADAFYAPVVARFHTYAVPLDAVAAAYSTAVRDLPAMQEWRELARAESQRIEKYERVAAA